MEQKRNIAYGRMNFKKVLAGVALSGDGSDLLGVGIITHMKTKPVVKVCIIDDHSVVRMGLKYMISYVDDVTCVGEAAGGEGAAAFVRKCGADVVLLDVRMPGVDGITALREILDDNPEAKVIMLSTSDAEEDIYRAVSMGAKGYLLKESDPNRLLEAIRTVADGGVCLPEELRRIYEMRAAERGITSREREILAYVAKGFSNEDIAKTLGLSLNTVKAHLKSILANLNVSDRAEAVAEGIHRGVIE